MASRSTMKEAKKIKSDWETKYPNRTFCIIDRSAEMQIGRKAAEMEGFEVIEDNDDWSVLAKVTQFDILEIRQCGCGAEILTAAVGEDGLNECKDCKARRRVRQEKELAARIDRNRRATAEWQARDKWEKR